MKLASLSVWEVGLTQLRREMLLGLLDCNDSVIHKMIVALKTTTARDEKRACPPPLHRKALIITYQADTADYGFSSNSTY